MSKIIWDNIGEKIYETGIQHGVLYPMDANGAYPSGVAWNGLTQVTESPEGAEATPIYADNIKYLNLLSAEEFGATVEAYTYPKEFKECDGSASIGTGITVGQQSRKGFGMAYKTKIGNDVAGDTLGYKIHLIYGALASPSEKAYQSVNDSPEAIAFSWELSTTPVPVANHMPTASLVIDSREIAPADLATLEDVLFGTTGTDPMLPLPDAILDLITP